MLIQTTSILESNNFLSKDMNTFISEDDIYVNFDKFERRETHACFVTGPSGSGKSTLAKKLARKYNAEHVELDLIIYAAGKKTLTHEFLQSKGETLLLEYMEKYNIDPESIPQSYDASARAARYRLADAFITWLVLVNKQRCIIEGCNLTDIIPIHPDWKGLPFVFKGTSILKAAIRRIRREGLPKFGSFDELLDTICTWDNMYRGNQSGYDYLRNMTMRHKGSTVSEVDEDSLTAKKMGIVFSDDDVHYNVNRFLNKEVPVLWITGMSGGGKSTLAAKICDKTKADLFGIDDISWFINMIIHNENKEIARICSQDKTYDEIHKFLLAHPEYLVENKHANIDNWMKCIVEVVDIVVKRHTKKNQVIIEGVQIPYIYYRRPKYFHTNCAIIIKGTSVLQSLVRRFKRDQFSKYGFIHKAADILHYMKLYAMWYRTQNEFRDHVTPNMESYAEAKDIYDSLPEDEQLWVSPRGRFVDSPYKVFHYVYKIHNKPVGFIDANKYNGKSTTDAFIVYAIKNEYRGKGISKILLSKAAIGCKTIGYKRLIYRCDINNIPSYRAALSFGFMLKSTSKTQYVLTYNLDSM